MGWTRALALAAALSAVSLGAQAQLAARNFPAGSHYGLLRESAWPQSPWIVIGHQARRVAPGFVARGISNERLSALPPGRYAVAWSADTQGQLLRLWIVSGEENVALARAKGSAGDTP
jgi:hypothetical protein